MKLIERDVEMFQRRHTLRELHKQELDGVQIAAQMGVTRQRVSQMRQAMGLHCPPTVRQARLEKVAPLVEQGLRAPEIAERLNTRVANIRNDIVELGLTTKTAIELREGALRQLLAEGKGQVAIGQALKLHVVTIRKDCRDLGLIALLNANNAALKPAGACAPSAICLHRR